MPVKTVISCHLLSVAALVSFKVLNSIHAIFIRWGTWTMALNAMLTKQWSLEKLSNLQKRQHWKETWCAITQNKYDMLIVLNISRKNINYTRISCLFILISFIFEILDYILPCIVTSNLRIRKVFLSRRMLPYNLFCLSLNVHSEAIYVPFVWN